MALLHGVVGGAYNRLTWSCCFACFGGGNAIVLKKETIKDSIKINKSINHTCRGHPYMFICVIKNLTYFSFFNIILLF